MKYLILILRILGFSFQYVIPFVLFGAVIPYYHGELTSGLTTVGKIALAVFILILVHKLKGKLLAMPDSTLKSVGIMVIECVPFVVTMFCLDWLNTFTGTLFTYWKSIIPYFALGSIFKLTAGILKSRDAMPLKPTKEVKKDG